MLPSYTIRESHRAKHVSLKISVVGSLEVIVPHGFDRNHIPEILQRKKGWIERVTRRMQQRETFAGAETATGFPIEIVLLAIAQTWQIQLCPTPLPGIRLEEEATNLVLWGHTSDQSLGKVAIQRWLVHQAQVYLLPWLWQVSQELNLPFAHASVRKQKTRWGSCSASKNISLNCKLLFLPPPLVRYVLIHELCHTVYLNHSAQFWALVERYEPACQQLDRQLRDARLYVPVWMEE